MGWCSVYVCVIPIRRSEYIEQRQAVSRSQPHCPPSLTHHATARSTISHIHARSSSLSPDTMLEFRVTQSLQLWGKAT